MQLANPVREIRTIKALLSGAETESRQAGDPTPGAEHLLLAALALSDGSAQRAFERVGADPAALRPAIAAQHADALKAIGITGVDENALDPAARETTPPAKGVFRATAQAQAAFRAAVDLSKTRRPSRLIGAHVVAAVAELEDGTVARTLRGMGIDRDALAVSARLEFEPPHVRSA